MEIAEDFFRGMIHSELSFLVALDDHEEKAQYLVAV